MKHRISIVAAVALALALGITAGLMQAGPAKADGGAGMQDHPSLADKQFADLGLEECRAYAASLAPDMNPDLTAKVIVQEYTTSTSLTSAATFTGDVRIDSGVTLDLNGFSLTVKGNLEIFGTLNVNGGSVNVSGGGITVSNGLLQMASGSITVTGPFFANGRDETDLLTGGTITVNGNFIQYSNYSAKSFCPAPNGTKVVIKGSSRLVSFDTPAFSWFGPNDLSGASFHPLSIMSFNLNLGGDLPLTYPHLNIQGKLNGRKLTVPANTSIEGPLTLGGGQLVASGSLNVDYYGGITMNNDNDKITVAGSLVTGGVCDLQKGSVEINGNFSQYGVVRGFHNNSWVCGPANKTKLTTPNGTASSKVLFDSPDTSCFGQLDATGAKLATDSAISLNYDLGANTTLTYTLATGAQQPTIYYGGHLNGHSLTVPESPFYAARQVVLGGGTLTVGKAAAPKSLTVSGANGLAMTNANDRVVVYGDYISSGKTDAGTMTAGEIDIYGNFTQTGNSSSFVASGTHTTKFFGANRTIQFDSPNASWFCKLALDTGSSINTASTVSLRYDLDAARTFNVRTLYYGGNMGGHDLTETGNLHIAGATVLGGAKLESTGAMTLDGALTMSNDNDRLVAGGDFSGAGTAALSNGEAEFKAGFYYSGTNYAATGTHKTTLSGSAGKNVIFDHPAQSYFAEVALGTTLSSSSRLSIRTAGDKDLALAVPTLYLQGNLGGKTVNLTGNLVVPSGTGVALDVGGGTLNVSGNMTLDGLFLMTHAADRVTVGGSFTAQGPDETGKLTNGRLTLKGNFSQKKTVSEKSFVCSLTHTTILAGAAEQVIVFDSANPSTKSTFGTVYILGTISCDPDIGSCSLKNVVTSANLSNLKGNTLNGRLVPSFSPNKYDYVYVLPEGVDHTTISAYMNETETVNDIPYEQSPVEVNTGVVPDEGTPVSFVVKSADGILENTYTVRVEKLDSRLKSLTLAPDTLSLNIPFDANTLTYSVNLPASVGSLTLTPVTNSTSSSFKFRVNGQDSTGASKTVPVNPGEHLSISVIVTAQDGISQRTYTVNATRGTLLTGFGENDGSLSTPFQTYKADYDLTVSALSESVSITPVTTAECTKLVIDNVESATATFPLKLGESKPVTVTAFAGETSFTYTLTLKRSPIISAFYAPSYQKPGMTLSPAFDAEGDKRTESGEEIGSGPFTLTLPATLTNTMLPAITPVKGPECKSVAINGGGGSYSLANLKPGFSTTLNIVATASYNGVTINRTFTLIVKKAPIVADLTPSEGTFTQKDHKDVHTFDTGVTEYVLNVPATGGPVYVTPTMQSGTVKVNGVTWDAETPVTVNPAPGAAADLIVVGTDVKDAVTVTATYTVHVVRHSPLTGIDSTPAISPAFKPATDDYTVNLTAVTSSVTITPKRAAQCTKLVINGTERDSYTVTALPLGATADVKIEATATDEYGASVSTYHVIVRREALISDITASAGTFSKEFDGNATSYNLYLSAGTSSVTLSVQKTSACSSFTINGKAVSKLTLTVPAGGKSTFTVYAVGNPTSYRQTFTITAYRIAPVTSITLSTGKLSPAFSTAGGNYTVSLPATTSAITFTPKRADSCSSLTIDGAAKTSVTLKPAIGGTVKTVLSAKAVNGVTYTWTITVTRAALLKSITLSTTAYKLTPAFSYTTLNYTVDIPATVPSLKFTATKAATGVYSMKIDGKSVSSVTLSPPVGGSVKASIVLVASDKKTTQTYTVTVRRAPLLTGISPSAGTISPAFDAGKTSYTVTIPTDTASTTLTLSRAATNVKSITVNGHDVTSVSVPVSAAGGSATVKIVAAATDNKTTVTYTVVVKRSPVLSGITVAGGALSPAFSAATRSYTVSVPATTSKVNLKPVGTKDCTSVTIDGVTATAAGGNATASRDYYPAVGSSLTATISAETAAGTACTYTVKIVRAALVTGIKTSSTTYKISPAFSATTANYTVNIPATVSSITVYATKASTGVKSLTINSKAVTSLAVKPPVGGSATATIVATATDGKTKVTYTVTVNRAALLTGITPSAGAISPAFAASKTSYTVTLPADATGTTLALPRAASGVKSITVNGRSVTSVSVPIAAPGGSATVKIVATATDNRTTVTYTVVVKRSAVLSSITVSGGALSPAFSPTTKSYTVSVPATTGTVTLKAVGTASCTSVTINGVTTTAAGSATASQPFNPEIGGSKTATITAKTAAGTTCTYTVKIVRAALVTGVRTSSTTYKLSPAFSATALNYTVNIPSTVSSITVYATKAAAGVKSLTINSRAVASLAVAPPVGGSAKASIVATATDGKTKVTYTVTVNRAALVSGITAEGTALTPAFVGATHAYTVYIPATKASQKITVAGAYAAKTIKINNVTTKTATLTPAAGGSATATISVLATDGKTKDTYTVVVKRLAPLAGLSVSGGSLTSAFNPAQVGYTVTATGDGPVTLSPVRSTGSTFTIASYSVSSRTVEKPEDGDTATLAIVARDSAGHVTITYTITINWA